MSKTPVRARLTAISSPGGEENGALNWTPILSSPFQHLHRATPAARALDSSFERDVQFCFPTPKSVDGHSSPLLSRIAAADDESSGRSGDNCKRGRPRADVITHLILEGSSSPSGIKCKVCNRVFPREKSLQAHLRTHTGERPYVCDYPGCSRAFTQSGQLKTHQRLHAGEKPFVCSSPGCGNRYTHANRTCPLHPYHKPQRSVEVVLQPTLAAGEDPEEVARWLENYKKERCDKTPGKAAPLELLDATGVTAAKRCKQFKRGLSTELEQENMLLCSTKPISPKKMMGIADVAVMTPPPPSSVLRAFSQVNEQSPFLSRRPALGDITPAGNHLDLSQVEGEGFVGLNANSGIKATITMTATAKVTSVNTTTPPSSPIKTFHLKKRWLKEVFQEQRQQKLQDHLDNLAMPIRWNESELEDLRQYRRGTTNSWSSLSTLVDLSCDQENLPNQPLNLSKHRDSL